MLLKTPTVPTRQLLKRALDAGLPIPKPPPPKLPALPLGSAAPEFALVDLEGRTRRLADFAGELVLVVFFNPRCGYCQRLAPAFFSLSCSLNVQ